MSKTRQWLNMTIEVKDGTVWFENEPCDVETSRAIRNLIKKDTNLTEKKKMLLELAEILGN